MAIGDNSSPQSRERLAELTAKLAALDLPHLSALLASLEGPQRVRRGVPGAAFASAWLGSALGHACYEP